MEPTNITQWKLDNQAARIATLEADNAKLRKLARMYDDLLDEIGEFPVSLIYKLAEISNARNGTKLYNGRVEQVSEETEKDARIAALEADNAELARQNAALITEAAQLRAELEADFLAMARMGANYDTHNPMRQRWEALRKIVVEAK